MLRLSFAAGVLATGIFSLQVLSHGETVPLRRPLDEFPLQLGLYRGLEYGLEPAIINKLGVTDFIMRRYTSSGRLPISLYVGYYKTQRTGAIIHSPKNCLPGAGWNILTNERVAINSPPSTAERAVVNRVIVAKGEDRQLVLYWYQERGRVVASEYWARAYMVWDSITRTRTDGALVRVAAPIGASEEQAHEQLLEFSRAMFSLLTQFLPD